MARTLAAPATVAMDAVFSNCRARPVREHPCDLGLARCCLVGASVVVGIVAVAGALIGASVGAGVGLGTMAYACRLISAASHADCCAVLASMMMALISVARLAGDEMRNFNIPPRNRLESICYGISAGVQGLAFGAAGIFLYATKQILGLGTAGIKGGITLIGASVGLLVGVGLGAYQAARFAPSPAEAPQPDPQERIAQEKNASVNQETLVYQLPVQDIPDERWFTLRTRDVVNGFDSLELAQWLASEAQRRDNSSGPWFNPYNRVTMTVDQCLDLISHPDEATRHILRPYHPLAVRQLTGEDSPDVRSRPNLHLQRMMRDAMNESLVQRHLFF